MQLRCRSWTTERRCAMPVNALVTFVIRSHRPLFQRRGFTIVHPAWLELVTTLGLKSPDDFLNHPGEIISGHRVPWKDRFANWRAGFGFCSVSCREAATLRRFAAMGFPVPEWIAAGED